MSFPHLETEENPGHDYEKLDWFSLCLAHFPSPGTSRRFLESGLSVTPAAVCYIVKEMTLGMCGTYTELHTGLSDTH